MFLSSHLTFSQQDLQKQLTANKWYVSGTYVSKSLNFTPKSNHKPEAWEANFSANGKIKRCDSIRGSLFDKEGKERKLSLVECDTTGKYQINKDMIRISSGSNQYYYRPKATSDKGFEFIPVKAEEFNKK